MADLTPHYRDWFAGYRFAPRRVAVDEAGVWVADSSLPVFVYVDLATRRPEGPISAQPALGTQFETWGIASDGDQLYVLGQRGLSALDTKTGSVMWQHPDAMFHVEVFGDRIWTTIGADVAEIDRSGQVLHHYGLPRSNSRSCAPQHGWVAIHATPERQIMPVRVARFEVGSAKPTWTAELHGSSGGGWHDVYATDKAVWTIRQTPWQEGEIRRYLCALDPTTGNVVSELRVNLSGRIMIHAGLAWAWSQHADENGRPLKRAVTAFDPLTGEVRATHELGTGNAPWPSTGPRGIWCTVWDGAPFLIGLASAGSRTEELSLEAVDASRFRPPPPPPITADQVEHEALQRIRADMRLSPNGEKLPESSDPGPFGPDIKVEAVTREGEFPTTRLVLYFRSLSLPDRLFARSTHLWDEFGSFKSDYYLAVTANLQETLHACGHGLPATRTPDETDVVWV